MKILVLIFTISFCFANTFRVSLKKSDLNELFLATDKFEVIEHFKHKTKTHILINEKELSFLTKMGVSFKKFPLPKKIDSRYKTSSEVEAILKKLHVAFPHLTQMKEIGKSVKGKSIWALKISDNPSVEENEPSILFNSMHHSREIMTPEVSLDIADYLLRNYSIESEVKDWVDSIEIWVVPMLNVDGNDIVWSKDIWWRKNASGKHGVDINRNYPLTWNKCGGASNRRRSQTYRGPFASSEPETQALMSLVSDIKPVFNISYHAYSEIVIYPMGCDGKRVSNPEVVETIGKELGNKLGYEAGTAWELLYSVDGGDIDWMYLEHQVIPYVVEVNSEKQGFHPNYDKWRDKTVIRNRKGWKYLLNQLSYQVFKGVVNDYKTKGIDALIYIYDKYESKSSLKYTYKVNKDGTFYLPELKGSDLVFLKHNKGAKSVTIEHKNLKDRSIIHEIKI